MAHLHRMVFKTNDRADGTGLDSYRTYFRRVFLENPSRDATLPSWVYEADDGGIVGFLGVVPRWMALNGQRVRAAISPQFVVDPRSRVGFVAVRLAKALLEGPQDLSIADEANDTARRIWEGLGGTTSLLHSLYWTRPLRPARLALSLLRKRRGLKILAAAARPLAPIIDALALRIPSSHLYQFKPHGSVADDLSDGTFLECLPKFAGAKSLRMEYDRPTLHWLLELAQQRKAGGHLQTAMIRNEQKVIGWYLYHLDEAGMAEVLQIAADLPSIHEVLDHLFYDASSQGAIAATGRLESRFLQALSDKYCLFHRRGPWVLVNAKNPEILRSFQCGDAFFSRLDGEWSLGF